VTISLAVLAVVGAGACGVNLDDAPGRLCDDTHPCREGRRCVDGACWSDAELDAGLPPDGGAPDAGLPDAGPQPLWQQRLHGFTGTTVDPACSVDVDPSRGNRVLAAIVSSNDARDTATADLDTAARLPGVGYGRLRGRITLPAPLLLRGEGIFASLSASGGGDWLRLGFDAQGQLLVVSDPQTLGGAAMIESFARDGGFGAGDYVIDVAWTRGGARVVTLDGVELARSAVPAGGAGVPPAALHLGIVSYGGDAGTGWTLSLSGWQLAGDPSVTLGDVP